MDGLIIIDKPAGMTSHDVCHKVRKLLGIKKTGHTGTLDPMAEGVLVVMAGAATRLAEYLVQDEKEYVASIRFGLETDTQDIWGETISSCEPRVTREALESVLVAYRGQLKQVPPMYSAIKHKGKHLYDYARKGETLDIPPRDIQISELELLSDELPAEARLRIRCSKGTYIRTLCHDIGRSLGCGAVMSALRRTQTGRYGQEQAVSLQTLETYVLRGEGEKLLLPFDEPLMHLPRVDVLPSCLRLLTGGTTLLAKNLEHAVQIPDGEEVRLYCGGQFYAVGRVTGEGIKPCKVFFSEQR